MEGRPQGDGEVVDLEPLRVAVVEEQNVPLVQEASAHARAAWRSFLESSDYELRLETMRLSPLCVQFFLERMEWLPSRSRPKKLCLSHVSFVSENMEHPLLLPDLTSPEDSSREVPESVRLMASLIAANSAHWVSFELEDNINNCRFGPHVCQALLANLPRVENLLRLRLRGIDLRRPKQQQQCQHKVRHEVNLSELVGEALSAHAGRLLELDLEACRFDDDEIDDIAKGMEELTHLQSLSIYECGMKDERMKRLVGCLGGATDLKQVLLYDNNITSQSFATFAKLLQHHPNLMHVKLAFWGRDEVTNQYKNFYANEDGEPNHLAAFNQALAAHHSLQKLDIFCKNTSAAQVVSWLQAFEHNRSLLEFRFGVFSLKRSSAPTMDGGGAQQPGVSLEMKYGMLAGNNMSELETLFQGMAQLRTISQLVLNQTHFYALGVGHAFQCALAAPQVCDLRLHSCRFHTESFASFVHGLGTMNQQLRTLFLAGCRMDDEMIAMLGPTLAHNQRLERLDLSWNNLTSDSIGVLTLLMCSCKGLQTLNLSHNESLFRVEDSREADSKNDISDEVLSFIETLASHPSLQSLDLAACSLAMPVSVSLMRSWEQKPLSTLHNDVGLHLGFASVERRKENGSGVELFCGVRAGNRQLLYPLLEAVSEMEQVETLEFCGTDLRGRMPGQRLSRILQSPRCSKLVELSIYGVENPPIEHEMLGELSNGLRGQTTLQTIRLGGCSMRDDMFQALAASIMESKCCLKTLFLRYNLLTADSLKPLATLLKHEQGSNIENLDLASNEMLCLCSCAELSPFVKALKWHKKLRRLCLSHCGVQDHVLHGLLGGLKHSETIQELDVGGNAIEISRGEQFCWVDKLVQCRTLTCLKIPRALRSDPHWEFFLERLWWNTSLVQLRRDQGQMPLVHTTYEQGLDGCPLTEERVAFVLRRNALLALHGRALTSSASLPWPHLLQRLGSNQGDGSPVYGVVRFRAGEIATQSHHS